MIINAYIIRNNDDKFLSIDDDGNWTWVKNLDDASVYKTQDEAFATLKQKETRSHYLRI